MGVGTSYNVTSFIEVACFERFSRETLRWIKVAAESIVGQVYISSACATAPASGQFNIRLHNSFKDNYLLA